MIEEFRDIKGYEGAYQVSNLGNVKSLVRKSVLKERILKPVDNGYGYLSVNLHKGSYQKLRTVHQLVAITFLGHVPCGCKIVVDHKDNNSLNNNKNNLQLITTRENTSKDKKGFTSKYTGVSWFKRDSKWRSLIRINGKVKSLGCFTNEIDAHNAYQTALKQLI